MINLALVLKNLTLLVERSFDLRYALDAFACGVAESLGTSLAYGTLSQHVFRMAASSNRKYVYRGCDALTHHCLDLVACEMVAASLDPFGTRVVFQQSHQFVVFGEALRLYGSHGHAWVTSSFFSQPEISRSFWQHFVLDSNWWQSLIGYSGFLFTVLYRTFAMMAIDGPLEEAMHTTHADLLSLRDGGKISTWMHIAAVSKHRSDVACDRQCLLRIAMHYGALAIEAAQREHELDTQVFIGFSQLHVQLTLLRTLDDCLRLPHNEFELLMRLFGILSVVSQAPLLTRWKLAFWRTKDVSMISRPIAEVFGSTTTTTTFTTVYRTPAQPAPLAPIMPLTGEVALQLYQLMDVTAQVLTWGRVRWFASHGTLLGAIRHGGIIPHDDDADITVLEEDAGLLLSRDVQVAFQRNGHMLTYDTRADNFCVYRLGEVRSTTLFDPVPHHYDSEASPRLHIFLMRKIKDYYEYTFSFLGYRLPVAELFNVFGEFVDVPFGTSSVKAPASYENYLDRMYGNDWRTVVHSMLYNVDKSVFASRLLSETAVDMALPASPLLQVKLPPWNITCANDGSAPKGTVEKCVSTHAWVDFA